MSNRPTCYKCGQETDGPTKALCPPCRGDAEPVVGDTLNINQCDGCRQKLPLKDGFHYLPDGRIFMGCERNRYE